MNRVLPLRTGWEPGSQQGGFYPLDLPEDWRLTYFANAFPAVALAPAWWQGATRASCEGWCEDTGEGFGFYLLAPDAPLCAAELDHLADLSHWLGGRFAGLVAGGPVPPGMPPQRCYLLGRGSEHPDAPAGAGSALVVPPQVVGEPLRERLWLESLAARSPAPSGPILALLGDCDFDALERWLLLTELMGLGWGRGGRAS